MRFWGSFCKDEWTKNDTLQFTIEFMSILTRTFKSSCYSSLTVHIFFPVVYKQTLNRRRNIYFSMTIGWIDDDELNSKFSSPLSTCIMTLSFACTMCNLQLEKKWAMLWLSRTKKGEQNIASNLWYTSLIDAINNLVIISTRRIGRLGERFGELNKQNAL